MEEQIREYRALSSVRDGELHLLLSDLFHEDEIDHYRRREAAWISGVVHVVIILLLLFVPKWIPAHRAVIVPLQTKEDTTFIELPPEQRKLQAPRTNRISDQNRIAQTRTPSPTRDELRKLLDARQPGRPSKVTAPPAPAQPPVQQAAQQPQAGQPVAQPAQPPKTTQEAKMEAPVPRRPKSPFALHAPGSTVSDAIHEIANEGRPVTSIPFGGNYGSGIRPKVDTRGDLEILSDTLGVDFGPYLKRLRQTVQDHWDQLIPQSALPPEMKKGIVTIEFAILKDGSIAGLRVINGSGDVALDRAAYGAITYSVPLPHLPAQFGGDYLLLRAKFFYNPDKNELE
ncbi:MAG TPA: TonB C-terminal domain-containing protein [Terriglobales bacterium]|nr:TonB C-terminal domain-containing protein [Terriglobales bacterium]